MHHMHRYADLVMRDAAANKPVFFVVGTTPSPAILSQLEARGFVVVQMWSVVLHEKWGRKNKDLP
jgi:hypothetical protein